MPRNRDSKVRHEFTAEHPATTERPALAAVSPEVIERGRVYFLYRPAIAEAATHGVADIRRFYLVLRPEGAEALRWIVIGHKKLPVPTDAGQRFWGFVDGVGDREAAAAALTGTRPAGEGAYALVRHHGHTHLAYALALPDQPGEVQRDLNIRAEASYLLVVKNPQASSPSGLGLAPERKAKLPDELQARFGDRRFLPLDTPAFLVQPGCELLLLGTDEDLEAELGFHLDAGHEACRAEDVLAELRLAAETTPTEPLSEGRWA